MNRDIRNTKNHLRRYDELHSDDITTLKFLPNKHLLTAATDGLLMYVDPSIEDDNDASMGCVNVGSSIANAGLLSDGSIYAFTDMQSAAFYTLDADNVSLNYVIQSITHICQGARVTERFGRY